MHTIEMLKSVSSERARNSLLFAEFFSFTNLKGLNDESYHLLQSKREQFNPIELQATYHNRIENLEDKRWSEDVEFRVNNISQANWNEVRNHGKVILLFDIGAPVTASVAEVQNYIHLCCKLSK